MARPFMFAALCYSAHPLKHLLAESEKQRKNLHQPKNSLAGSLITRGITVVQILGNNLNKSKHNSQIN